MDESYPRYYAVNDRPVKIVRLPNGGADILVLDWATGAFVPDRGYFAKVSETGIGKDVDQLTEAEFDELVRQHRREIATKRAVLAIVWERTGDEEFPYRARVDGHTYTIRVKDSSGEARYTLLIDGEELADLDDWPEAWTKPEIR